VRDIVLIVFSILIAFILQAWWDDHRDRRRLHNDLLSVRSEFEAAHIYISENIELLRSAANAIQAILSKAGPTALPMSPDSVQDLMSVAWGVRTLEVASGALNALLSSDDMHLIRNDTLKSLLGGWEALVYDARENTEWLREHGDERLIPLAMQYLPSLDMMRLLRLADYGPSKFPANPQGLLRDPVIESELAWRAQRIRGAIVEAETLLETARTILRLSADELGLVSS
jgi:hypothetical protein